MAERARLRPRRYLLQQPAPIVQRWVQRKVGPVGQRWARAYMRWRLPPRERARRLALDQAFTSARRYAEAFEDGDFPAVSVLFNIALYLLLAERDIQALKIDALTHPDAWTRKLNARIILLTIYEWDADKVSGRAFRNALDAIDVSDELRAEAVAALRDLRAVQAQTRHRFSVVRNNAIAHRNPDALEQYRAIRDLREAEVIAVAIEFYAAVERYMKVLTALMQVGGRLDALLRQHRPAKPPVGST